MKLQAHYETIADVPDGLQTAFEERDGKAVFVGGELDLRTGAEYKEIQRKKQEGFDKFHEANNRLKEFEGIDPSKHREILNELDVLRAKSKDGVTGEEEIADIVKARVERLTEDQNKKIIDLSSELDDLRGFKLNTQKSKTLSESLADHVSKDALEDAKFIVGSAIDRQADGTYMSNGKLGFETGLSVEQLVLKAIETRPHWKKQNTPGHGATGSNGVGKSTQNQRFEELRKKVASGKADKQEIREMNSLAANIHAEQKK